MITEHNSRISGYAREWLLSTYNWTTVNTYINYKLCLKTTMGVPVGRKSESAFLNMGSRRVKDAAQLQNAPKEPIRLALVDIMSTMCDSWLNGFPLDAPVQDRADAHIYSQRGLPCKAATPEHARHNDHKTRKLWVVELEHGIVSSAMHATYLSGVGTRSLQGNREYLRGKRTGSQLSNV